MKTFRLQALILATSLSATAAQAGLITVQYEGVITSSENTMTTTPGGPLDVSSYPLGTRVTGSFTFGSLIPDRIEGDARDSFSLSPTFEAEPNISGVSSTIAIDGGIRSGSGSLSGGLIAILNSQPRFTLFFANEATGDQFVLGLNSILDNRTGRRLSVRLELTDSTGDLFSAGDLTGEIDQVLTFLNDSNLPLDDIEGSFSSVRPPRLTGPFASSDGTFELTSISATSSALPAPSPTYVSLLMLGISGLALRRRGRKLAMQ